MLKIGFSNIELHFRNLNTEELIDKLQESKDLILQLRVYGHAAGSGWKGFVFNSLNPL